MITLLKLWLDKAWGYLLVGAAVLAGYMTIRQSGKVAGRREAEREQDKATIKGMQDARDAREEIDSLGDAAVRDRARQRMRNRAE